jgi:hypothetical protein
MKKFAARASIAAFIACAIAACSSTSAGTHSTATQSSSSSSSSSEAGPALSTATAPWPDPDQVQARVAAAGLTGGGTEMLTVHYHVHLDIFVNGISEPVAASIGREDDSFYSPLHTHATSGMIHIEAATNQRLTLGMLFTEWGVRLTDTCVGAYCKPTLPITAYVDGQRDARSIPSLVLRKGDEIALVIGTPPTSIPRAWDCKAQIDSSLENPAQCVDFS